MKVIINKGLGNFTLSNEALLLLIKLKPEAVDKAPLKDSYLFCDPTDEYKTIPFEDGFFEYIPQFGNDDQSDEGVLIKDNIVYTFNTLSLNTHKYRSDPVIISIIEELKEKANPRGGELKIIEIPEGVDFYIDSDDTFDCETVVERHRRWN